MLSLNMIESPPSPIDRQLDQESPIKFDLPDSEQLRPTEQAAPVLTVQPLDLSQTLVTPRLPQRKSTKGEKGNIDKTSTKKVTFQEVDKESPTKSEMTFFKGSNQQLLKPSTRDLRELTFAMGSTKELNFAKTSSKAITLKKDHPSFKEISFKQESNRSNRGSHKNIKEVTNLVELESFLLGSNQSDEPEFKPSDIIAADNQSVSLSEEDFSLNKAVAEI